MCTFYLHHISVQSRHILGVQWPRVASGSCIEQHAVVGLDEWIVVVAPFINHPFLY